MTVERKMTWDELVAEVERLRAALGRILYRAKDLNEAEEIARAALAKEEA